MRKTLQKVASVLALCGAGLTGLISGGCETMTPQQKQFWGVAMGALGAAAGANPNVNPALARGYEALGAGIANSARSEEQARAMESVGTNIAGGLNAGANSEEDYLRGLIEREQKLEGHIREAAVGLSEIDTRAWADGIMSAEEWGLVGPICKEMLDDLRTYLAIGKEAYGIDSRVLPPGEGWKIGALEKEVFKLERIYEKIENSVRTKGRCTYEESQVTIK